MDLPQINTMPLLRLHATKCSLRPLIFQIRIIFLLDAQYLLRPILQVAYFYLLLRPRFGKRPFLTGSEDALRFPSRITTTTHLQKKNSREASSLQSLGLTLPLSAGRLLKCFIFLSPYCRPHGAVLFWLCSRFSFEFSTGWRLFPFTGGSLLAPESRNQCHLGHSCSVIAGNTVITMGRSKRGRWRCRMFHAFSFFLSILKV